MNSRTQRAKDSMLAFLMTLPPNRRGGVLKEVLRRARIRLANSQAEAEHEAKRIPVQASLFNSPEEGK